MKDKKGYLIYVCRNCGEKLYSTLFTGELGEASIEETFNSALNNNMSLRRNTRHDCNDVMTGFADLIGYVTCGENKK